MLNEPSSAPDPRPIEAVPRVGLSRVECARALGCGTRMIDTLIAGRRGNGFPVAYCGRKPIIPVDLLRDWLRDQAKGARR